MLPSDKRDQALLFWNLLNIFCNYKLAIVLIVEWVSLMYHQLIDIQICRWFMRPWIHTIHDETYINDITVRTHTHTHTHTRTHDYQSLPNVVPDPSSNPQLTTGGGQTKPRPQSANTIRRKAEASLAESEKRLKAIEVRYIRVNSHKQMVDTGL